MSIRQTQLSNYNIVDQDEFITKSIMEIGKGDESVEWNQDPNNPVRYKQAFTTSGYSYWIIENTGDKEVKVTFKVIPGKVPCNIELRKPLLDFSDF